LRYHRLRSQLREGNGIGFSLYEAGFGSSSRLYEFAKRYLGMTPRSYKNKGEGEHIIYTITTCPLGFLLIAATSKGICVVRLGSSKATLLADFKKEFNHARLEPKDKNLHKWTQILIDYLSGEKPWPLLPYDVQATAFQKKVWDYLRSIPSGKTYNYE